MTVLLGKRHLLEIMFDDDDEDDSEDESVAILIASGKLWNGGAADKVRKAGVDLQNYNPDLFRLRTRFALSDLERLRRCLGIPSVFTTSTQAKFRGNEALYLLLRRMAYPNRWRDILGQEMRHSVGQLSTCFNDLVEFLYNRFKDLLFWDSRRLTAPVLARFADVLEENGCLYDGVFGFLDGTMREIARPTHNQRLYYSGHYSAHGLKFQAASTPDGIVVHLAGPFEGRRNDKFLLRRSGLLDVLDRFPQRLKLYCDAGYGRGTRVVRPLYARHDREAAAINRQMSSLRISVEHSFRKPAMYFAYCDYARQMKVELQPVGAYYVVAVLLSNCHTCLYGHQVAMRMHCEPPSLEDYLGV